MTCNVTGPLILPTGEILPNTELTFQWVPGVSGTGTATIVGRDVPTTSDAAGLIDVDLQPGQYLAYVMGSERRLRFAVGVPDAATASLHDCIEQAPEITPGLVQQVVALRDEVVEIEERIDLGALDAAVEQTGLDRIATAADVVAADAARIAAETARDGAFVNAAVYASTSAAQADSGLANGEQYQVVSGQEIIRYRKDSSSASTELVRYATAAATQEARRAVGFSVGATFAVATSGSVNPSMFRAFNPTVGQAFTIRARFHRSGIRYAQLICTAAANNGGHAAIFDCQTDSLTTSVGTGSWRDIGGGWVEVSVTTAVSASAATATFQLRLTQTGAFPYTANGTDGKHILSYEVFQAGTTTNLFPSSDVANAAFSKVAITTSTTNTPETLPWPQIYNAGVLATSLNVQLNGAAIACRLTEASGTTNSRIYRAMSITSGTTYRLVVEAKRGARKWLRILSNANALWSFTVNLETGESLRDANTLYAAATITTTYVPGGFWRIEVSVEAVSSGAPNVMLIVLDDTLTWPNRTGDGASGLFVNTAELFANGVSAWRTTDFSGAEWVKEGITVTPNAEIFGGVANEIKNTPGLVDVNGRTWTSVPNGADGIYGPGKVTLNGRPYFTPGSAKKPDLHGALRAALAYEVANNVPIAFMGDSIEWASHEFDDNRNAADMFTSFINQGSPGDEPILHAVADYLLVTYGITVTGPRTNGNTGPVGESLVMQPGCVLTFTGNLAQLDTFFNQLPGAGTLTYAFNGVPFKTVNAAGTTDLDRYSGPSATGQTASGTYTITCSGGPVEITGIDRLGIKAAGTPARVRVFRWAHGSWNFSHFGPAQIAALVKQSSALSAIPPTVIAPLGINERQAVGTSGLNTMKSRFQTLLDEMVAGGIPRTMGNMPRTIWEMPLRTSAAADAGFYASALSYDNLISGMSEVLWQNSIPFIGTHALNLAVAGKMDADGIHPTEAGLYDKVQMRIEGICRIRGVLA